MTTLRQVRRIAAYGVCRDGEGRVLLVRASPSSSRPGPWNFPGGGIDHGEDPAFAVVRKFREEAGLLVEVVGVRGVSVEVCDLPHRGYVRHQDQIVFDVRPAGGASTGEVGVTSRLAGWFSRTEIGELWLSGRVKDVLGVIGRLGTTASAAIDDIRTYEPRPDRGQRFSAYGVVTDPDGLLLLTMIADNYPGAGTWHLPGGGTDFGEDPATGLMRELTEEAGQFGRVTEFLWVAHQHNPAAWGPEGRLMDWHGVRVVYRVTVDTPTDPVVGEVGGSTAAAGWFTPAEVAGLRLNRMTAEALARAGAL